MTSYLGGLKDKSVLDIGCGWSEYQRWLSNDCTRLVGVDISVEMLKLSQDVIGKAIEPIVVDALHLPFKDKAFDVSVTFQALHHFPDWKKDLAEMVRTAKQISL